MICPHCGTTIPGDAKFCSHCGQSTASASANPFQNTAGGTVPAASAQPSIPAIPMPSAQPNTAGRQASASQPGSTMSPFTQFTPQTPATGTIPMPPPAARTNAPSPSSPQQPMAVAGTSAQANNQTGNQTNGFGNFAATFTSQFSNATGSASMQQTFNGIKAPHNLQTMLVGLAIGFAAALVLALPTAFALSSSFNNLFSELGQSSELTKMFSDAATGPSPMQKLVGMMIAGIAGSFTLKVSAMGVNASSLGVSASIQMPMTLSGLVLLIGTAFGVYLMGHKASIRFKWTGVVSSVMMGIVMGGIYLLLANLFPLTMSASLLGQSGTFALTGATFRTFGMTFLLTTLGALIGYALLQYAPDSTNMFRACWRCIHRMRGFARTFVETLEIYTVVYTVISLVLWVLVAIGTDSGAVLLYTPLLFPYLPLLLLELTSFGGISVINSEDTSQNANVTYLQIVIAAPWVLLAFVLFAVVTLYIALRASARNLQDRQYAKWSNTWKFPVAAGVFWLIAGTLLTTFSAKSQSGMIGETIKSLNRLGGTAGTNPNTSFNGSIAIPAWYFILAMVWAFASEAIAMTFGQTMVAGMPKIIKGGLVEATPTKVTQYIQSCGATFSRKAAGNGNGNGQTQPPAGDMPVPPTGTVPVSNNGLPPQNPGQNGTPDFSGRNAMSGANPASCAPVPGQTTSGGAQTFGQSSPNSADPQTFVPSANNPVPSQGYGPNIHH